MRRKQVLLPPVEMARYVSWCLSQGDAEDVDRQARRQVRVTKEHNEEVRRLLKLMGIPYHDVSIPFLAF